MPLTPLQKQITEEMREHLGPIAVHLAPASAFQFAKMVVEGTNPDAAMYACFMAYTSTLFQHDLIVLKKKTPGKEEPCTKSE